MAKINGLDKMTYAELKELRERVDEAMAVAQAAEKASLKAELEARAAEAGFSMADLMGGRAKRGRKTGSVAPKYRNPKNPDETWAGRGRQPRWLSDALKKGSKLESFEI